MGGQVGCGVLVLNSTAAPLGSGVGVGLARTGVELDRTGEDVIVGVDTGVGVLFTGGKLGEGGVVGDRGPQALRLQSKRHRVTAL